MNVYKVNLIGDISAVGAATYRNELCQTLGNLSIIKNELDDDLEGVVGATQSNSWRCESPIQFNLPASNAYVLYRQVKTDTVCTEQVTNLMKKTLVEGDICVVLAPSVLPDELRDYTVTPVLLSATTPQYLLVGQASDSQLSGITPFSTAIGKAYFSREMAMSTMAKVQAAKASRLGTAVNLVNGGQL